MISRRRVLFFGAATCLSGPLPFIRARADLGASTPIPREPSRIAFKIIRKGEAIGTHILDFTPREDGVDINIAVDIAVQFGPIVVYRYKLRGLEQWRGGAPFHLEALTNHDGTKHEMRADWTPEGPWVTSMDVSSYLAPREALPATHWNQDELVRPWINPEDGKLLHPVVGTPTATEIALADGQKRTVERYTLTGDAQLDLLYDTEHRWTALEFTAGDGSHIIYAPM